MTKTHTVREWLEQLPEPFTSQAISWMEANKPHFLSNPCSRMGSAIGYLDTEKTEQGWDYWIEVSKGYCDEPFKETQLPTKPPLSNLLDPSEGWTQEGFVWANESHDQIIFSPGDILMVRIFKGSSYTAPTVLSAMAMVNQYRREQWQ